MPWLLWRGGGGDTESDFSVQEGAVIVVGGGGGNTESDFSVQEGAMIVIGGKQVDRLGKFRWTRGGRWGSALRVTLVWRNVSGLSQGKAGGQTRWVQVDKGDWGVGGGRNTSGHTNTQEGATLVLWSKPEDTEGELR